MTRDRATARRWIGAFRPRTADARIVSRPNRKDTPRSVRTPECVVAEPRGLKRHGIGRRIGRNEAPGRVRRRPDGGRQLMAYTLLGHDFTPPDLAAKVTGKAKYAEDFRADGMLFCRLLTSTMPHARVKIDATEALAMEGVVAVLTADDVPPAAAPQEPILTNEPLFVGDRILAVAARSEELAQEAIERIKVEYEP